MSCGNEISSAGVPLFTAKVGTEGVISRISGKDDVKRHLNNLGFTIGEPITVTQECYGSVIVDVRGSRVAIDRSMTSKIMITPKF